MSFTLPKLPYKNDDLQPILSKETLDYHYGKHHQTYINNLNSLVVGTEFEESSLEAIIKSAAASPLFNNAAQCFNHAFYWNCLTPPKNQQEPTSKIVSAIKQNFGGIDTFKANFSDVATKHFGSGWIWLVKDKDSKLQIIDTHDAGNPLTNDLVPLLTMDVWEHAYYIDYRNTRPEYIKNFWQLVNWQFVEDQF